MLELGHAPVEKVRRVVGEFTGQSPKAVDPEGVPLVVCSCVGYATAEGLRQELERAGATCELRED